MDGIHLDQRHRHRRHHGEPTEGDEGGLLKVTYARPTTPDHQRHQSPSGRHRRPTHSAVTDAGTTVTANTYQWRGATGAGRQPITATGDTFTDATGTGATTARPTEGDDADGSPGARHLPTDGSGTTTQTTSVTSNVSTAIADSADLGRHAQHHQSDAGYAGQRHRHRRRHRRDRQHLPVAGFARQRHHLDQCDRHRRHQRDLYADRRRRGRPAQGQRHLHRRPGTTTQTTSATSNVSTAIADSADLVATLSTTSVTQDDRRSASPSGATAGRPHRGPPTTSYQWQGFARPRATWTNATGRPAPPTPASYTPTEGDEGGLLQVNVTYTDGSAPPPRPPAPPAIARQLPTAPTLWPRSAPPSLTQDTPVSVTVTDAGTTVTADTYQWQVSLDDNAPTFHQRHRHRTSDHRDLHADRRRRGRPAPRSTSPTPTAAGTTTQDHQRHQQSPARQWPTAPTWWPRSTQA